MESFSVTVIKPEYDCTNGGLSSQHGRFLVVLNDKDGEAIADSHARAPRPNAPPILVLERHTLNAVRLRPLKSHKPGKWVMFGGNYAVGDSRFGEAVARVSGTQIRKYDPVSIHDRFED